VVTQSPASGISCRESDLTLTTTLAPTPGVPQDEYEQNAPLAAVT
jgi:hypothetical protein